MFDTKHSRMSPMPPCLSSQHRAWREAAALFQLGNSAWQAVFSRILPQASWRIGPGLLLLSDAHFGLFSSAAAHPLEPVTAPPPTLIFRLFSRLAQAAAHIKSLLGLRPDSPACSVQFGGNTHELVLRLLSSLLDTRQLGSLTQASSGAGQSSELPSCPDGSTAGLPESSVDSVGATAPGDGTVGPPAMRVLASDCEFYSFSRQLNRLIGEAIGLSAHRLAGHMGMLHRPVTHTPERPSVRPPVCRGGAGRGGGGALRAAGHLPRALLRHRGRRRRSGAPL